MREIRSGEVAEGEKGQRSLRLAVGLGIAVIVMTALVMSFSPATNGGEKALLSQAMLSGKQGLEIDSQGLATRVVEQKFQVQGGESVKAAVEIPYVDVWVLNDPFYPLMGEINDLLNTDGTLSSKEWQMLGFPDYEAQGGTTPGAPASSTPSSSTPVTSGLTQRVVLVESVYEMRGIKYATVKVNDVIYDKLKAGSEFAEVFRLQEIKGQDAVVVLCGDEEYELKVDQLRKI